MREICHGIAGMRRFRQRLIKFDWTKYRQRYWNVAEYQYFGKWTGWCSINNRAAGDKGSVRVSTENKIRRALGGKGYTIIKQDGTKVKSSKLLPSAFFTINKSGDTFVIKGGGFGHGIGMSQTGANEMAKCGKNYQEILTFFIKASPLDNCS